MFNSQLFNELYQMSVPIFVPSLTTLIDWHIERGLLWETYYWHFSPNVSHSHHAAHTSVPHPHVDERQSWLYWYNFSDYYNELREHIQYFDSIDELFKLLRTVDLCALSSKMQHFNAERNRRNIRSWAAVIQRIYSTSHSLHHGAVWREYDDALFDEYALRPHDIQCERNMREATAEHM